MSRPAQARAEDSRDAELARRIRAGDRTAVDDLYERVRRPAFALARRILADDALAERVLQDVVLAVWRDPGAFDRGRGSFSSWVLAMVHRDAVDAVRREETQRRREHQAHDRLIPGPPAAGTGEGRHAEGRHTERRHAEGRHAEGRHTDTRSSDTRPAGTRSGDRRRQDGHRPEAGPAEARVAAGGDAADGEAPEGGWTSAVSERVRGALAVLPSLQREALTLAFYGGYTQREVAALTGAPLATVKTRMLAGMRRLCAELGGAPGGAALGGALGGAAPMDGANR